MPQGYSENVSEREDPGYEVLTISATDKDKDQRIEFWLSTPSPNFSIDRSTGWCLISTLVMYIYFYKCVVLK